jgi:hypothetical protein
MTPHAIDALRRIRNLRKYPFPQSKVAEDRILKDLNVTDFTHVVNALETDSQQNIPTQGRPESKVPRG